MTARKRIKEKAWKDYVSAHVRLQRWWKLRRKMLTKETRAIATSQVRKIVVTMKNLKKQWRG